MKLNISLLCITFALHSWVRVTQFRILNPNTVTPQTEECSWLNDKNECQGCCLTGMQALLDSDLDYVNLKNANLVATNFTYAKVNFGCFIGADIRYARFSHVFAVGTNFDNTQGDKTSFTEGNFVNASFNNADLPGCSFIRAQCSGASFKEAILSFAQLKNANFTQADFTNIVGDNMLGRNAQYDRAQFNNADLQYTVMTCCSCIQTDFSNIDARYATFDNSDARQAVFTDADLSDASFNGCNLQEADLTNVIINNKTSFKRANLRNATVDVYQLKRAQLYKTVMPNGEIFSNVAKKEKNHK